MLRSAAHMRRRNRNRLIVSVVFLLLIGSVIASRLFDSSVQLYETVRFGSGDTITTLYGYLSSAEKRSLRLYLHNNPNILHDIQIGNYVFSGNYTPQTLIEILNQGPSVSYDVVKILEGWSIYDIDDYLTSAGYIHSGEYIDYISRPDHIQSIRQKYDFVDVFLSSQPGSSSITPSLEGLLYPDTYHINIDQDFLNQLVSLQLKAFQSKVYNPYRSQIDNYPQILAQNGYHFTLGRYNIVTLASIVEKEERATANKPTIAGIFLNRIESNMQLGADITLCYGLHRSYSACTPSLIAQSIADANNVYNTRVHRGLTPGPIANPAVTSFEAVLQFHKTNYYYYLHGSDGAIHYGQTLEQHNNNKQYL